MNIKKLFSFPSLFLTIVRLYTPLAIYSYYQADTRFTDLVNKPWRILGNTVITFQYEASTLYQYSTGALIAQYYSVSMQYLIYIYNERVGKDVKRYSKTK